MRHRMKQRLPRLSAIVARMVCLTVTSGCRLHVKTTLADPKAQRAPTCSSAVVVYPANTKFEDAFAPVGEVSFWWPPDMQQPRQEVFEQRLREAGADAGATRAIVGWDSLTSMRRFSSLVYVPADSERVAGLWRHPA
jgi:hypothetical protein